MIFKSDLPSPWNGRFIAINESLQWCFGQGREQREVVMSFLSFLQHKQESMSCNVSQASSTIFKCVATWSGGFRIPELQGSNIFPALTLNHLAFCVSFLYWFSAFTGFPFEHSLNVS
jgi:hypothetical protein